MHSAEEILRATEYSLLLTFGCRGEQFEQRVHALAGKVDGLLIAEEILSRGELRSLAAQVPVVVIAGGRDLAETDVLTSDNERGIVALTEHLTGQHGYRRLCFVAGPKDAPDAMARHSAFEQAVSRSPGSVLDQVIHGDFSEDSGIAAARVLLGGGSLPQAVACANDQMAIGVLRELQRSGIRVPADVAVTGFDDLYPSRVIDPALTTVSQPFRDLGGRATQRLLARISDPALPPRAEELPTLLAIRASCGCPWQEQHAPPRHRRPQDHQMPDQHPQRSTQ